MRAFSTEGQEKRKFGEKVTKSLRKGITDAMARSLTSFITAYLDLGAGVLILWYGGRTILRDQGEELSVGKLITFQLYWNMLNNAYKMLNNTLNGLTKAAGAAQRVLEMLDSVPDIDPSVGAIIPAATPGHIRLSNVEFVYQMRPNNSVLSGISMDIRSGSVQAIVGKSGGGKTTLINLLLRFYDPSAGSISIDGRDLTELNLVNWHEYCGHVAQDTQLFATSIEENIAYGVEGYTQDELESAAKLANCYEFIMGEDDVDAALCAASGAGAGAASGAAHGVAPAARADFSLPDFEDGFATMVGERGVRISGGQKQRIAIARVLLRKPRLLLLDEATSALDAESEALVQEALDKMIADKSTTVVLVAHRLSTVKSADNIAVIDGGSIVESGTHEDLCAIESGIYAKLVSRQQANKDNQLGIDELMGGAPPEAGGGRGGRGGGRGGRGGGGRGDWGGRGGRGGRPIGM